jgi:hypothetical protein
VVARTPWLVLLNGEGLVSFHAQGEGLTGLDQALEELRANDATAGAPAAGEESR